MPSFLIRLVGEITKNTVYMILALFFIGGSQRVANYYEIVPAQKALSVVDGVLVQERATIIAQGTTVASSATIVVPMTVETSDTAVRR